MVFLFDKVLPQFFLTFLTLKAQVSQRSIFLEHFAQFLCAQVPDLVVCLQAFLSPFILDSFLVLLTRQVKRSQSSI